MNKNGTSACQIARPESLLGFARVSLLRARLAVWVGENAAECLHDFGTGREHGVGHQHGVEKVDAQKANVSQAIEQPLRRGVANL